MLLDITRAFGTALPFTPALLLAPVVRWRLSKTRARFSSQSIVENLPANRFLSKGKKNGDSKNGQIENYDVKERVK